MPEKKLLYVCYMNLNSSGTIGIKNKIINQIKAMEDSGIRVCYIWPEGKHINSNMGENAFSDFSNVDRAALSIADDFDAAYIRLNCTVSASQLLLIQKLKKRGAKVLFEVPTYPFDGEIIGSIKNDIKKGKKRKAYKAAKKFVKYKIRSLQVHKYVDRVVTYSDDKRIWGIKTINIQNGVNADDVRISNRKSQAQEMHAICVSSCAYWHGYDRFIAGLGKYYETPHDVDVYLDVVGDGGAIVEYKYLSQKYNIEDKVLFHGKLCGDELEAIYDQADIALDAMGRHRSGVKYNSSLKGKEYLAKGLPIVSGVRTELDKAEDFPFYYRVPANDSPINIGEVLEFYKKILEIPYYKITIREYAEKYFSFEYTLRNVISYICE